MKFRLFKDYTLNTLSYLFSGIGVVILILIFTFLFSKGARSISWDLLTGDYYSETYTLKYREEVNGNFTYDVKEGESFSKKWGVAFIDDKSADGEEIVKISYIDKNSPFKKMENAGNNQYFEVTPDLHINKAVLVGDDVIITIGNKDNAASVALKFDKAITITNLSLGRNGGGIRGSILSTLALIGLTLLIALPFGIITAIYLSVYAKNNRTTRIIEELIDLTGGIPSIIFGLAGVIIFIPMIDTLMGSEGKSIIAGAFTLAVMLLPVIIKTTKEAIMNIPSSYQMASLALGASKTDTTFKIILPNAVPGILTSTLLAIGRIIGESAALIFVMGTQVVDKVSVNAGATSLATHIWSLLGGENPNFELACAISLVIMFVVLVLNISVKLIGKGLTKKYGNSI